MTTQFILFDWGNTLMVDFHDEKGPMYAWSKLQVIEGIPQVLEVLAAERPLFVASNAQDSTKEDIEKALEKGGIRRHFSDVFCHRTYFPHVALRISAADVGPVR